MYPRGLLLLLCSSSFRHALLAPLLGFQGYQKCGLAYFKYTWALAPAHFTDFVFTHGQFQKSQAKDQLHESWRGLVQVTFHLQLIKAKPGLLLLLVLPE